MKGEQRAEVGQSALSNKERDRSSHKDVLEQIARQNIPRVNVTMTAAIRTNPSDGGRRTRSSANAILVSGESRTTSLPQPYTRLCGVLGRWREATRTSPVFRYETPFRTDCWRVVVDGVRGPACGDTWERVTPGSGDWWIRITDGRCKFTTRTGSPNTTDNE